MAAMSAAPPRRLIALAIGAIAIAACAGPPASSPTARAEPTPATSAVASAPSSAVPSPATTPAPELTATAISERIGPDLLQGHLDAFQAIADDNGGNRATGTPGFERSVEYVIGALTDAEYEAERVAFDVGGVRSWNVIAERPGEGDGVVILGAHVDSVAAGAGMNDNATGVTALLAIAEALQALPAPSVTVRFAFWGAEEGGPFGSAAYVASLDEAALADIRAYLNFDMLGSPNGVTFVYDEPDAAVGSEAITNLVTTYFERRGLPW
jgi:aminopeptidase S